MSKFHQLNDVSLKKYYIITRPTSVSDIDEVTDEDSSWLAKSRQLQARRWRHIQDELA